jgi:hypothetical protein
MIVREKYKILERPEAKAWLEEFGFKKGAFIERKKQSFGSTSSASSSDRWSFEDVDKTVLPLGVGIRSTLGKFKTIRQSLDVQQSSTFVPKDIACRPEIFVFVFLSDSDILLNENLIASDLSRNF